MMDTTFSVTTLVLLLIWLPTMFLDMAGHAYVLQLKEYRWDKIRDFFRSKEGHKLLFEYTYFWRAIVGLALYIVLSPFFPGRVIFGSLLVADLLARLYEKKKRGFRRPDFTKRALLVMGLAMLAEFLFILFHPLTTFFVLLLVARFPMMFLFARLTQIPTTLMKRIYLFVAKRKMKRYPDMQVIGITGSYGKTTTKTFLLHLLEGEKRVVGTAKNDNSDLAIARFILRTSFEGIDACVIEIGAYKMGDIALIANIIEPDIAILTAINQQHLSLFGSQNNIQKTKYELLRGVGKDGLAITNSDNALCREFLHELISEAQTYGSDEQYNPNFLIEDLGDRRKNQPFVGTYNGEQYQLHSVVAGDHVAKNLAPCVMAARRLGVSKDHLERRAKYIELPRGVLQEYAYGKATIIDDSYNSNPDGFMAAIDTMTKYPSSMKRIVVTRGILELGDKSDEIHEKVGGAIAYSTDELVLIKEDFAEPIKRGLVGKYKTEVKMILEQEKLLAYLQACKEREAVILLENLIPPMVYKEIQKDMQHMHANTDQK